MSRALFSLLLVAPLAAGCVTLLPKNRPAQLYRFEAAAPQSPSTEVRNHSRFPAEVALDST